MTRFSRIRLLGLVVTVLPLTIGACTNPVGRGGDHPAGVRLKNEADVQVASFRVGGSVIGQIAAVAGTAATFTVETFNRNEAPLVIDGSEIRVVVSVTGGVATAAVQETNRLVITPTQIGDGTVDLTIMHSGHPEFTARIPIAVTALDVPD